VALVIVAGGAAWMLRPGEPAASTSTPTTAPTATSAPTPTATPTPTPTPTGHPANTASYDLEALPPTNVFTVLATLPVDDDPFGSFTGEQARSRGWAAPVFADPAGEPIAHLPRDYRYDGTIVPVIAHELHWVKVLLTGRQAVPSQGDPAQVAAWLRVQDVELAPTNAIVEVRIGEGTIDVWRDGMRERVATDFGWGTKSTPTPLGRSFIMTIRTEPSLWYTRGHPLVYLSVQSPTLDGFGGVDAAITAFHYHDTRSGSVSNGCIRLDAAAIEKLAKLPLGTPVVIRA
jgi:hypothetical protein